MIDGKSSQLKAQKKLPFCSILKSLMFFKSTIIKKIPHKSNQKREREKKKIGTNSERYKNPINLLLSIEQEM